MNGERELGNSLSAGHDSEPIPVANIRNATIKNKKDKLIATN